MSDLTALSDAELLSKLGRPGPPVPSAAPPDVASMSNEDLMKALGQGAAPSKAFTGSVLPVSAGEDGKLRFDSDAGIIGTMKRAVTLPGDVYTGKVDPKSEEAIGRSLDLAGMISPTTPAIRAGGAVIPGAGNGLKQGTPEVPSAEALKAAAVKGFDTIREMGVDYSSGAVAKMAQSARADLEKEGFRSVSAPKVFSIIDELTNPPAGSVAPIGGLQAARRAAQKIAQNFNDSTEQAAASEVIRKLDKFIEAADPSTVVAGPAADAAKLSVTARGNYAAAKRSEKLSGIEDTAELRAAAANSGQNLGNTLRQRATDLVSRPKEASGFVQSELDGLEGVARGSVGRNTARALGNLLGGGGGMGAVVTSMAGAGGGGAVGGLPGAVAGAAAPILGFGAKRLDNSLTARAFGAVDEATRMRSPLYEEALASPPMIPKNIEFEKAMARTLMSYGRPPAAEATSPTRVSEPSPAVRRALVKLLQEGGA